MFDDTNEVEDFWSGNLTDVKEEKNLLPPTKDVKLLIREVDIYDSYDDGSTRLWKQIRVNFELREGIEVAGEIKYRGSRVSQMIPYFAEPNHYDYKKPFFAKAQFLVPLVQLVKATQSESPKMIKGGLEDEAVVVLVDSLKGKTVLGTILQVPVSVKNPDTGIYEATADLQNEVKYFKQLPDSMSV